MGNSNYQQGTAIIIKMFWWRNVNLCEWNVNERKLVRKADGVGEQLLIKDERLMIIHTLPIKRGVHQAEASASNWTAINIKIFWWRNANLCEWNVN